MKVKDLSNQMERNHKEVDCLDAYERNDHAADTPDQQILPQERVRTQRLVADSSKSDRNKQRDDQRVKYDGRKNRRSRRVQMHNVDLLQPWQRPSEQRRDNREIFRNVIRNRERRESAARH